VPTIAQRSQSIHFSSNIDRRAIGRCGAGRADRANRIARFRHDQLVVAKIEDVAECFDNRAIPRDASDERHRFRHFLTFHQGRSVASRNGVGEAFQDILDGGPFLKVMCDVSLREDATPAGNPRNRSGFVGSLGELIQRQPQPRHLFLNERSGSGCAIVVHRNPKGARRAISKALEDLNLF
jgi:hypothetical protein